MRPPFSCTMRGRPEEWRTLPPPGDIALLVKRELQGLGREGGSRRACAAERIVLDPGFGFGKKLRRELSASCKFQRLGRPAGFPLLVGHVRASHSSAALSHKTGKDAPPERRLYGGPRHPGRVDPERRTHCAHSRCQSPRVGSRPASRTQFSPRA